MGKGSDASSFGRGGTVMGTVSENVLVRFPAGTLAAILADGCLLLAAGKKMRLHDEVGDSTGTASQVRQDVKWRCRVLDLSGSRSVWDGMGPLCGVGRAEMG